MSLSSSSLPKFDVFLSFNTKDTTTTFVSDLYRSLSDKGVTTYFKDDKLQERGSTESIIRESKLAVVVVSESYPTSVWCLNELQTLLNLQDKGQLSVLTIFYGVDPSNIRKLTGKYMETLRNFGQEYSAEKVQSWRKALTKLTITSGLDSRFWSKEAEMIDLIASEILLLVSNKQNSPLTTNADGHVALDRHMKALNELLDLKSNEEIRLVGIWGPGGIGKTTLARFAYEDLCGHYPAHLFIENAKNIYQQDHDEPDSQETFTSGEIQEKTRGAYVSIDVIKSTVRHRKSLLVIDCLDNIQQFQYIADIVGWCGSGSRVIFITQNKSLLDECGVEHVYEVKSLRYDEALQLFSQFAFEKQNPPTSFESLSHRAVQIASFLPLTLKILGSSLRGKDEEEWEKELQKLERDKEKTIMKIMKKKR